MLHMCHVIMFQGNHESILMIISSIIFLDFIFRSIQSYSFLRRGNSINSRERNKPHMNLWNPIQPSIIDPSTNVSSQVSSEQWGLNKGWMMFNYIVFQAKLRQTFQHLPRNRSDYSLPASPRLSRCLSETNKYPMDQNPKFLSTSLNMPMPQNDM